MENYTSSEIKLSSLNIIVMNDIQLWYLNIFKKYQFHTSKKPDPTEREAKTIKYLCGFD